MLTKFSGTVAELMVQLRAAEKGITVSKPTTDARYDFIVDYGNRLERVQVKYANGKSSHSTNVVIVSLRRRLRVYKADEVDALLVYVPKIGKVLRFPPDRFCLKTSLYVRIGSPERNTSKGFLMADDFVW